MSYSIFARKYRPQTFSEVLAQKHITETLTKAIEHDRIGQAYLFCGQRGTGKTSVARILAKRLNCATPDGVNPCNKCASCQEIVSGSSLDILEIDAASNTSVDDIRELRESIKYSPVGGKHKVYIIDEVHRLSGSAFDALLKTLEEPPAHAVFIFATTEAHKVPQTILSRCQRYDFRRISQSELQSALKNLAKKENLHTTDNAIAELARRGDGSFRDAMSLLDQVASWQRDKIDMQLLTEALGILPRCAYQEIMNMIREKKVAEIIPRMTEIINSGISATEFVRGFQEQLRIMLMLKAAPEIAESIGITTDEANEFKDLIEYYSLNDLLRIQNLLVELEQKIRDGFDPQINLELALLKLVQMESSVTFDQVLQKLAEDDDLEAGQDSLFNNPGKKKDELTPVKATEVRPPTTTKTPEKKVESLLQSDVDRIWHNFLKELKAKNRLLLANLSLAQLRSIDNEVVRIAFGRSGQFQMNMLKDRSNYKILQQTIKNVCGKNLKFEFIIDDKLNNKHSADNKTELFSDGDNEDHPLVAEAIKILDAKVIGREDLPE